VRLGFTGFLDFIHRPVFKKTKEHSVSETESVSVFRRRGEDTQSLDYLSKGPNGIGVCPLHLRTETHPVCETLCSLVLYNTGRYTQ
jgi:hypothetical protein